MAEFSFGTNQASNGFVDDDAEESECDGTFNAVIPGSRATINYNGLAEFAFRYCPPGDFMMGSPITETLRSSDEDQHPVSIAEGFWICETPTTQAQWDAVGIPKKKPHKFYGANLPVINVSWLESSAFIEKLNESGVAPCGWRFALPTEEQWEYACRAGTSGADYGVPLDDCAWYGKNSKDGPVEVGLKEPNAWGVFDMLGNVYEWICTKYRVCYYNRGGCWGTLARYCRPASRSYNGRTFSEIVLGFRMILVRCRP